MKKKKIVVTGGAGYIGSHTIVELSEAGFDEIYSIDNYINSSPSNYNKLEKLVNQLPSIHELDLTDRKLVFEFFKNHQVDAVIHFAALKSVPESVDAPNKYYRNNLNSLINVLDAMHENKVNEFIFSSSCSVYGNPQTLPVTENFPFGKAESPYANTKQMGEEIIQAFSKANPNFKAISLRYFNPVGAHPSALIGEGFSERPNNLVPIITQTAAGLRDKLIVFGNDYNTKDGSCIRDYIHVCDIADAHVKAVKLFESNQLTTNYKVINLGSGVGTSVFEMLQEFENTNDIKVPYEIGARRAGDVESIYANNDYAKKTLGWTATHSLAEMLSSAWKWQKKSTS